MNKNEQDLILGLFGELSEERSADLEQTLAVSVDLREERERLRTALDRYRSEGEEEPPEVDYSAFERSQSGIRRVAVVRWLRIAAGILVVVAAYMTGRTTRTPKPASSGAGAELQALASETADLRRQGVLLALHQQNVSGRIAVIERIVELAHDDPSLSEAVQRALSNDPNVNVRLAAVDALFAVPGLAPQSADLTRILARESSQAIRLALVDWIAAARPRNWEETLRSTAEGDKSPAVRSRALQLREGRA